MSQSYETEVTHVEYESPDAHGALTMPIYQNVAFEFNDAERMHLAFAGKSGGHAYSRITNPTVSNFERRIKTVKKALSVTAVNTGMSAIAGTLLSLCKAGGNVVTSKHLFGNTISLIRDTLGPFGVELRLADLTKPDEVEASVDSNTCAIFLEIITNPQLEVADLKALSEVGKRHGAPLVADTTVIPFTEFDAKGLGVAIEIFSSTKYISGGGTSLGGVIIDYGQFGWKGHYRLAEKAAAAGAFAFTATLRGHVARNVGLVMTPQVAYMHSLGLETLRIRFRHQSATAKRLAELLRGEDFVRRVNYTGLEDNAYHTLATRQFGEAQGAVLTFDLAVGREACFGLLNRLKLIKRATNLFENKTLAIHPASTIFGTFTPEELAEMDVSEETIRISVGLEDAADLIEDIRQAAKEA